MNTLFANSPDGTRVVYDWCGAGPAVVLLQGGGGNRQEWHAAGYVRRLWDSFTVITLDLRGHGESGKPTDPADYTTGKMGQDVLAVADACGVERFSLWGMSFGAKLSRYLAIQSDACGQAHPDKHSVRTGGIGRAPPGCHRLLCALAPYPIARRATVHWISTRSPRLTRICCVA